MDQIQAKLTEMDGYAKAEPTLGPTLENIKTQVEKEDTMFKGNMDSREERAEREIKGYESPAEDPWIKASKWTY